MSNKQGLNAAVAAVATAAEELALGLTQGGRTAERAMEVAVGGPVGRWLLRHFMRSFRVSEEDAEELTQDTFVKFWRTQRAGQGSAFGLLCATADSVFKDHYRHSTAAMRDQRLTESLTPAADDAGDAPPNELDRQSAGNRPHDRQATLDCVRTQIAAFGQDYPSYAYVMQLLVLDLENSDICMVLHGKPAAQLSEEERHAVTSRLSQARKLSRPYLAICRD